MSVLLIVGGISLIFWMIKKINKLEQTMMMRLEPLFSTIESVKSFTEKMPTGPIMAGVTAAIPALWRVIRGKRK